jgi:hypothetical protein
MLISITCLLIIRLSISLWIIIEFFFFFVKSEKHDIKTLSLVQNRVRFKKKKNLQKSTLALKGVGQTLICCKLVYQNKK